VEIHKNIPLEQAELAQLELRRQLGKKDTPSSLNAQFSRLTGISIYQKKEGV